jgi:hypothetical protein
MIEVARFGAAPFIAGLFVLLWAAEATAQNTPSPPSRNERWDISVWIAGATGEENTDSFAEARIWSAGVVIGRVITTGAARGWRQGSLEYGFDLIPAIVQSRPRTVFGGGFEPVILRWKSSHHLGLLAPYIELAGGALFSSSNLPPGNTSAVNFTARAGGGIQVFTKRRQALDVGCRWWHVSNANLGVRNPEFNGVQVGIGYHWFK